MTTPTDTKTGMAAAESLVLHRFPASSEQLQHVRQLVRDVLKSQGCSGEYVDMTVLAVDEATTNIVRHAYSDDEKGDIILQILRQDQTLVFRLIDNAPEVDSTTVRSRDLDAVRPGGLGVYLIDQIMDTMSFEKPPGGSGNMLVMTRKLDCK